MKLKTRTKCRHFMDGSKITSAYVVEVCLNRQWTPVGEKGITRYETKEAAEAAAKDIASREVSFA